MQETNDQFHVGIGMTLHDGNQEEILRIREDLFKEVGIKAGMTLIRGTAKSPELKNVKPENYKKVIDAIELDRRAEKGGFVKSILNAREVVGHRLGYEAFVTAKRTYDCYAGTLMGVLLENGAVYPCEMLKNRPMGNIRDFDYDIQKVWQTTGAHETREWIKKRECCCTYECQFTCNTLFNPKKYPSLLRALAPRVNPFK